MSNNGGNLTVQYNLRWSEELRDKIADAAKENTRSMNQEIVARLEESFTPKQESFSLDDPLIQAHLIAMMASRYDAKITTLRYALRVIGDTSAELTETLSQQIKFTQIEKDGLGEDLINLLSKNNNFLNQITDKDLKTNLIAILYNFQYDLNTLPPEEFERKYPNLSEGDLG